MLQLLVALGAVWWPLGRDFPGTWLGDREPLPTTTFRNPGP